jgi:integrase
MTQRKRFRMQSVSGYPGLFKQGTRYRIDFTIDGRRYNRVAGDNKELAIDIWREARMGARREANSLVDNSMRLADLWDYYLKVKRGEVRASTWTSYEFAFAWLRQFFKMARVRDLNPRHVAEYIVWRRSKNTGIADETINRELSLFRAMLNRGVRDGKLANNPIARVPGVLKPKTKKRRALEQEEYRLLLDHRHRGRRCICSSRYLWVILGQTGLRKGELAHLRWEDVNLQKRAIQVRPWGDWAPKSEAGERVIPMTQAVFEEFRQRAAPGQTGIIFPEAAYNVRRRFLSCCKAAEIHMEGLTLHSLRHTLCTWLIQNGESVKTVQRIMGHSDVKTTLGVYAHTLKDDSRRAMARIDQFISVTR